MKYISATVLMGFAFFNTAAFAIELSVKKEPYDIHGQTAAQLREQMNRNRPVSEGKRFDADTKWYVKWKFEYEGDDRSCELSNPQVVATVTYHLPRWVDYDSAPADLKSQWDTYMGHLLTHEKGHATNGEKAAKEIESLFKTMPPMEGCSLLDNTANAKAQQILALHNAWDSQYDEETQHGKTQGAVFP